MTRSCVGVVDVHARVLVIHYVTISYRQCNSTLQRQNTVVLNGVNWTDPTVRSLADAHNQKQMFVSEWNDISNTNNNRYNKRAQMDQFNHSKTMNVRYDYTNRSSMSINDICVRPVLTHLLLLLLVLVVLVCV